MDEACSPLVALIRLGKNLGWILARLRHQAQQRARTDPSLRNLPTDPVELCEDAVQEALERLIEWPMVKVWTKEDLYYVAAWNMHLCIDRARSSAYESKESPLANDLSPAGNEDTNDRRLGTMDSIDPQTPEDQYLAKLSAQEKSFAPTDLRGALKAGINSTRIYAENKADLSNLIDCCLDNRCALKVVKHSHNIIFKWAEIAKVLGCPKSRVKVLRQMLLGHAAHLGNWLEDQGYGYVLSEIPRSHFQMKSPKPDPK